MKSKKKIIGNGIFLILVFGLTMYGVFYGEDLSQISESIQQADNRYLYMAVVCVIAFIFGESLVLHYLLHTLSISMKRWKCFLISSVGFFFSCITPSASGGQPMQIVFLKKEKVSLPVSTLVLMVITITYKLVLVLIGIFLLVFQHDFVRNYLQGIMPVFYAGMFLNVLCIVVLFLLVFHPQMMRKIVHTGYDWMVRVHLLKYHSDWMEKLDANLDVYHETARYLKENYKVMVYVFLLTALQRIILFVVTYFVYRSFGLKELGVYEVTMLQAVIAIAVDMLPLPGGMGISEKLFSIIFAPVFGSALILPAMILSRGLSYYTELIVSAFMTMTASFTLGRAEKIKGQRGNLK